MDDEILEVLQSIDETLSSINSPGYEDDSSPRGLLETIDDSTEKSRIILEEINSSLKEINKTLVTMKDYLLTSASNTAIIMAHLKIKFPMQVVTNE